MGKLERLFDRFRRKGDVQALGEVFDLVGAELMRVASHLSSDLSEAEDLVQETFVVAIEGAAGWDRSRRLTPWLCGILVNRARLAHRRAQRSPMPGSVGRSEVAADEAPEAAQSAELNGIVEDALRKLPDLYREVLVPHLVDGARPVDIAHRLDRAPGTVRMQIQRGLALLRKSLPPGLVLGASVPAAYGRGVRGLAALRAELVAHAAKTAPALASTLAQAPLVLGGIVVSTKLVALAVVAGALALAWLVYEPASPGLAAPSAESSAPKEIRTHAPRETSRPTLERVLETVADKEPARTAAVARPASPTPTAAEAGGWFLEGNVYGILDGDRVVDVSVTVFCFALEENRVVGGAVAPDGSYSVDLTPLFTEPGPPARELLIAANHERYASGNEMLTVGPEDVRRAPTERTVFRRDLHIQPACGMRGRLVLDRERLRETELAVFPLQAGGHPAPDVFRTATFEGDDEDGSFEFRSARPGEYVVTANAPGLFPMTRVVTVPEATLVDLGELRFPGSGSAVRGVVHLPDGSSARARVEALCETVTNLTIDAQATATLVPVPEQEHWNGLAWRDGAFAVVRRSVRTDERGAFSIEGLTDGAHSLTVTEVEGFVGLLIDEGPSVDVPVDGVTLHAGTCRIDAEVRDAEGEPLVAEVELSVGDGGLVGDTGIDGRASFLAEIDRDYELVARRYGYVAERREALHEERSARVVYTFELEPSDVRPATLELELRAAGVGDDVAPVPQAKVTSTFLGREGAETEERILDAQGGLFRFDELRPGRYDFVLEPNENSFELYYESFYLPARLSVELASGATSRATIELERGGRVRVHVEGSAGDPGEVPGSVDAEVLDSNGEPVDVRFVTKSYEGNVLRLGASTGSAFVGKTNAVFPNLPAGTYTLVLRHHELRFAPVTFTIRAGATVDVRAFGQAR